ncbi:hypothetical protein [Amycolatopsis sp. lyj-23]|uniref:hypothetical protein n=1 Tax=Amycolatopsis sp. lyj-23 TaxID=2789283 RepID=UPI00397C63A5
MKTDLPGPRDVLEIPAGHPARRPAAWALWCSVLTGAVFTAWAYATTQFAGISRSTPWQDDPYHGMISFTEFLVPAVTALMVVRASLWRRGRPQPVFRVNQIARACLVSAALVALTVLTDVVAVLLAADRDRWDTRTPWLVASLLPLALLAGACFALHRTALRRLPHTASGRPDGDWLDDLAELVRRTTGGRLDRPIGFVRDHIVAFAVLLSALAGFGVASMQALGEGGESPLLFGMSVLVGFGGFLAFCLIANAVLHIAEPRGQTGQPAGRLRKATRVAVIAGALALPAAAVLRDRIWQLLGHHAEVDSVGTYAGITVITAAATGLLVFGAAAALPSRGGARPGSAVSP